MEPELTRTLQYSSREQLIALLHQLAARHPALLPEMIELLAEDKPDEASPSLQDDVGNIDEEVTENWDFSGDEPVPALVNVNPPPVHTAFVPLDYAAAQQRIATYSTRLGQGETVQTRRHGLAELFKEAQERAEHHDYQGALDLYALLLDTALSAGQKPGQGEPGAIFDPELDDATPALGAFLAEVSSILLTDETFSPLLPPEIRLRWIERLFALWLQRVTAHRSVEQLSDILYSIMWQEDTAALRALIQQELQRPGGGEGTNIVNFTQQYRARALERLLKGLPRDS